MKRYKHITINLTEEQYDALLFIANKQDRKTADLAYILLLDSINKYMLQLVDRSTEFTKLKY